MLPIIPPNSSIVLAISGGPDSVFLLHQLINTQSKLHLTIYLAHFNHQTRGKDSDRDEGFVRKISHKTELPLFTSHLQINQPNGKQKISEEKLRNARYSFLEKIRQNTNSDYIVTAHHLDDQVETIIYNFLRGTGPKGLTGMSPQHNKILRPLLDTGKNEILKYLKTHHIKYRQDKSNQDTDYRRNLIRRKIIPLAEKINSQTALSILQLSETLRVQQDFIDYYSDKLINKQIFQTNHLPQKPVTVMNLKKFISLHPAIQTEIIKKIISPHVPVNKQLTAKVIHEVKNILIYSRNCSQKILFDTLSISKKNDKIYLRLLG